MCFLFLSLSIFSFFFFARKINVPLLNISTFMLVHSNRTLCSEKTLFEGIFHVRLFSSILNTRPHFAHNIWLNASIDSHWFWWLRHGFILRNWRQRKVRIRNVRHRAEMQIKWMKMGQIDYMMHSICDLVWL